MNLSAFCDPKFHYPVHNNPHLVPSHRQRKFKFIVEIPRIATSMNVSVRPFPVSTTDINILLPRQWLSRQITLRWYCKYSFILLLGSATLDIQGALFTHVIATQFILFEGFLAYFPLKIFLRMFFFSYFISESCFNADARYSYYFLIVIKGKFSLFAPWGHIGWVKLRLHSFLISAWDEGVVNLTPGPLYPQERSQVFTDRNYAY
jgi:hypothetical protein